MRNSLIAVALSLASMTSAFASNWHYVAVGNDDATYFFDADTIEKNKDKTILLWVKTVQTTKPESDGSWSTSIRWKVNCTKRTIQTLMWSTYDQGAQFIKSSSTIGAEKGVFPDSSGEAMLKIACDPSFPNDKSGRSYFKLDNNDPFLATRNLVAYEKSKIDQAPK
jgi:hypothetical protein